MPATAAPPRTADYIVAPLRRTIGFAENLVKDIPAEKFAYKPHPNMNHPAFCMGHLSLYPNRIFTIIGQPELIVEKPGFPELFQAGTACIDQDGHYPHKDEIIGYYVERYNAAAKAIAAVPDEVFQRENPLEGRMKEIFPFVGIAVNFLLNNHHMMHLGQISAWRRAIGLGSVM
jgi:hypothetical protein